MFDAKINLLCLLKAYDTKDVNESSIKDEMISFLNHTNEPFGKSDPTGHITASAFIVSEDYRDTLLTHHFKLGRWLQLGGHTEVDERVAEGALREAREESGLTQLKLYKTTIFDLDIHEIPERKNEIKHLHYDVRFLIVAKIGEPLVVSDESHDLKWVPIVEVTNYTDSESIQRMCRKIIPMIENIG